ncbi:NmrA family transcriptional regulator [Couchioplanes caeruleus subsp. azureus]|nr:NmrA family transcriptional regulator [Couchioplanes caeruleus subsp. azureus]
MILVTGATGKVGREVVDGLLMQGWYVRAVSRRPESAGLPSSVEVRPGSPEDVPAMTAALEGVESAFVVLVGDVEAQARGFAEAAAAAGQLKRLVLLSSSSVVHPVSHRIGDEHRAAEEILSQAVPNATMLRPGPFHSNSLWWAKSIRETGRARCLVGNQPGAPVDPADVASVGVAALTEDGHAGQAYELTGPELLTSGDQVRVLEQVLGRTIGFDVASIEEAIGVFSAISGDPVTAERNVRALHSPQVPWSQVSPDGSRLLGRPLRTYREWAAAHRGLFV